MEAYHIDFLKLLNEQVQYIGLSGQKDDWRDGNQWTDALNSTGDRIGIYVGNPKSLWLYIEVWKTRDESAEEVM